MANPVSDLLNNMRQRGSDVGSSGTFGKLLKIGIVLFVLVFLLPSMFTYVEPGHVGILIHRAGGGVDPKPLGPGLHFRNPLLSAIEEYPVFMQTLVLTRETTEGAPSSGGSNERAEHLLVYPGTTAYTPLSYFPQSECDPSNPFDWNKNCPSPSSAFDWADASNALTIIAHPFDTSFHACALGVCLAGQNDWLTWDDDRAKGLEIFANDDGVFSEFDQTSFNYWRTSQIDKIGVGNSDAHYPEDLGTTHTWCKIQGSLTRSSISSFACGPCWRRRGIRSMPIPRPTLRGFTNASGWPGT